MLLAVLTFLSMANAAPVCRIHISPSLLEKVKVDEFLARNYRVEISGAENMKEYLGEILEGDYGLITTNSDWLFGVVEGQIVQRQKGSVVPVGKFSNALSWKGVHSYLPDCAPQ